MKLINIEENNISNEELTNGVHIHINNENPNKIIIDTYKNLFKNASRENKTIVIFDKTNQAKIIDIAKANNYSICDLSYIDSKSNKNKTNRSLYVYSSDIKLASSKLINISNFINSLKNEDKPNQEKLLIIINDSDDITSELDSFKRKLSTQSIQRVTFSKGIIKDYNNHAKTVYIKNKITNELNLFEKITQEQFKLDYLYDVSFFPFIKLDEDILRIGHYTDLAFEDAIDNNRPIIYFKEDECTQKELSKLITNRDENYNIKYIEYSELMKNQISDLNPLTVYVVSITTLFDNSEQKHTLFNHFIDDIEDTLEKHNTIIPNLIINSVEYSEEIIMRLLSVKKTSPQIKLLTTLNLKEI